MLERILEVMKEKGLSPSQFADEIGIQRSGMSHLISGRNKPSLEFIMKIMARFPDTDLAWLIQGNEKTAGPVEKPKNEPALVQNSLFDEPEVQDPVVTPKTEKKRVKAETEKAIEKIVVFYSDRSFREYSPE